MRVLTKLIYGIFSFNPCNPKKGYKDQKIPLLSMKDLFLYTMRLCQNADTAFFYAQSPDFLKPGLCYYPKFSYL